ncbi:hypothetical protein RhiirA4_486746 [Rhizophagus irregularis]|uniref:Uncharacterized protein n=1 Tax=Rhizophagus irregularis TaxID=588596 RepID=A0A2I1HRR4_9GLOM|nr:hypothetical protein RhiirA4_486746 [Rhizophagus irregularis]
MQKETLIGNRSKWGSGVLTLRVLCKWTLRSVRYWLRFFIDWVSASVPFRLDSLIGKLYSSTDIGIYYLNYIDDEYMDDFDHDNEIIDLKNSISMYYMYYIISNITNVINMFIN